MPACDVVAPQKRSRPGRRPSRQAAESTRPHSSITGAPTSFVHVTFAEEPEDGVFADAAPSHPLLIEATARAATRTRK